MKKIAFILACSLLFSSNACVRRAPTNAPKVATTDSAREERTVITYEGEDGKTALELLKARASVRTTTSSFGELVEEINGVASANGHYLIFFVNGKKSMTGAGTYVTIKGDRIEWKLIGPRKN